MGDHYPTSAAGAKFPPMLHDRNAGKAGWRAIGFDDRFVWAEPFGWYDGEGAGAE